MFVGIRPEEAARLRDNDLNLADGEVRIRAEVAKTHAARALAVGDTPLGSWLRAYRGTHPNVCHHAAPRPVGNPPRGRDRGMAE